MIIEDMGETGICFCGFVNNRPFIAKNINVISFVLPYLET